MAIGKDTLLRGEYRLLETIGDGESRVYLARRETGGESSPLVVARLWQPSAELLHEHGAQALFERAVGQMRSAGLLRHPVFAQVETSGVLDDGTLFLISEHVDGTPLDAWIDKAGIPPLPSVIDLAYRVCSGLNAAHRNGLAHASLHPHSFIVKPQNEGGPIARLHAKLIDFGAPTCMFGSPPSLRSARFMAPEQLELALKAAIERGEPTVRMNVYGCGALLYYLCTGGPPLPGQSIEELLVAHAAHKILPPSRINPQIIPALDSIILKALDPDPRARFANAAELANALISIRFDRSASGVRPRASSDPPKIRDMSGRPDRTPRDRRITVDASQPIVLGDFELEERATSKTQKLPGEKPEIDEDAPGGFPSERPTAQVRVPLPSLPPFAPLTPLPPSLPPAEVPAEPPAEDVTAQAPLPIPDPTETETARGSREPPPAVLARPARRSLVPSNEIFGRVPPGAFIAIAALLSISVIYAVISPTSSDSTIAVTPLAPTTTAPPSTSAQSKRAPEPKIPTPSQLDHAGSTAAPEAQPLDGPKTIELAARPMRSGRRSPRANEVAPQALPAPEDPIAAPDARIAREAPPAPPPEPEPEPSQAPAREESVAATAPSQPPASTSSAVTRAPSPIAPLPEKPVNPIAPLPAKAVPRFYDVAVKGSLATSQVRRGIERIQAATQGCYRAALAARPSALGEVSLEVVVDERGRARSARASGDVPSSLKRCLENAAGRISVPPPDTGTVTATWKVSL